MFDGGLLCQDFRAMLDTFMSDNWPDAYLESVIKYMSDKMGVRCFADVLYKA